MTPRDQLLAAFQDLDPVTNFTVPSHEWSEDVCKAYMAGEEDARHQCYERLCDWKVRLQASRTVALGKAYERGWAAGVLFATGLAAVGLLIVWIFK